MDSVLTGSDLFVALLYIAIGVAALSLTAAVFLALRKRPFKKDELQACKLNERLAELTAAAKSAPKSSVLS